MGKKQKSKRNITAAATQTSSVTFVREVRQHEEIMEEKRTFERMLQKGDDSHTVTGQDYLFPKSNFYLKASLFVKKGNLYKSTKFYLQGIENSCVHCIYGYSGLLSHDGLTSRTPIDEPWKNNKNSHLVFPLLLEGAIRGNAGTLTYLINYCDGAKALKNYWSKDWENKVVPEFDGNNYTGRKNTKKQTGKTCEVCGKRDSDTVTLKRCDRCTYYYYCSSTT